MLFRSISIIERDRLVHHLLTGRDTLYHTCLLYTSKSLESIVGNPFQSSTSLTSLTLDEGCANYLATGGALISRADGVLRVLAGGVQKVTLGEECKAIGDNAIFGCKALERLELPYVKEIGTNAFVNCTKLAELYLPRLERIKWHHLSFSGVGSLRVVDLHLSNSISGLEVLWPDKETTTVYVATEAIKTELAQKLTKCQIVVGAPAGTQKRCTVNYSCNEGGTLEAWTTGAQDVNCLLYTSTNDGDEVVAAANAASKRMGALIAELIARA